MKKPVISMGFFAFGRSMEIAELEFSNSTIGIRRAVVGTYEVAKIAKSQNGYRVTFNLDQSTDLYYNTQAEADAQVEARWNMFLTQIKA